MKEPRGVAQTLVRDYRVELLRAGEPVAAQTVTANHQRRNAVSFDGTLCDSVRVHVLATNGCEEHGSMKSEFINPIQPNVSAEKERL